MSCRFVDSEQRSKMPIIIAVESHVSINLRANKNVDVATVS